MASPTIGLDIGSAGIRAAEVHVGKGGPVLRRFGQVGLPAGAVRDGEVVDPAAVAVALKDLWGQAGLKGKKVAVGVAHGKGKVVVRRAELAWMTPKELRAGLAYQVADVLPMPVDQAVVDYHQLEEFTDAEGRRMLRVVLVAVARDLVGSLVDAVQQAGLSPTSVDLAPFALLRALAEPDHLGLTDTGEVLVDVGADVTNLVVHSGGVPGFVRIVDKGGAAFTEAVAERLGVAVDEAERLKTQHGVPQPPVGLEAHPAARALDHVVGSFVDEVRGTVDFYAAQPHAVPLRRLVLCGGGSLLQGLAQRLATATNLQVEYGSPLARMEVGDTGLSPEQLQYVAPMTGIGVGLALGAAA